MIPRTHLQDFADTDIRAWGPEDFEKLPWGRSVLVAVEPISKHDVPGRAETQRAPGLGWLLVVDGVAKLHEHGLVSSSQVHPPRPFLTVGERVYALEAYPVLAARWALQIGAHEAAEGAAVEETRRTTAARSGLSVEDARHAARNAVHRSGDPLRSPLEPGYPPEPTSLEQVGATHAHDCTACRGATFARCRCGECSLCAEIVVRSNGSAEGDAFDSAMLWVKATEAASERAWHAELVERGVDIAHPDDGWVDSGRRNVYFAYPSLIRVEPAGGVLVALGTPRRWRLVRLTNEVPGLLGHQRWGYEEVPVEGKA